MLSEGGQARWAGLALTTLFACVAATTPDSKPIEPLTCPEEARHFGARPPMGNKEYCAIDGDNPNEATGGLWQRKQVQHGPSRFYWPNGKLQSQGNYRRGEKHGSFRRWHHNGQRTWETVYRGNKRHGIAREWSKDGILINESPYFDGRLHGSQTLYYDNGNIRAEYEHVHGLVVDVQQWPPPGQLP